MNSTMKNTIWLTILTAVFLTDKIVSRLALLYPLINNDNDMTVLSLASPLAVLLILIAFGGFTAFVTVEVFEKFGVVLFTIFLLIAQYYSFSMAFFLSSSSTSYSISIYPNDYSHTALNVTSNFNLDPYANPYPNVNHLDWNTNDRNDNHILMAIEHTMVATKIEKTIETMKKIKKCYHYPQGEQRHHLHVHLNFYRKSRPKHYAYPSTFTVGRKATKTTKSIKNEFKKPTPLLLVPAGSPSLWF
jgi:hypothetical protein